MQEECMLVNLLNTLTDFSYEETLKLVATDSMSSRLPARPRKGKTALSVKPSWCILGDVFRHFSFKTLTIIKLISV